MAVTCAPQSARAASLGQLSRCELGCARVCKVSQNALTSGASLCGRMPARSSASASASGR